VDRPATVPPPDFVLGLDLGQAQDYSALAVLERTWAPDPADDKALVRSYALRHLKRWPLGTAYPLIVAEVATLAGTPPLDWPILGVDQTGVGGAVVGMLRAAALPARLRPVLITAGHATLLADDGVFHVAKKELVSVLQVLLQSRRLKIAPLPERDLLLREFQTFKVKVTAAANETFEAWRERDHDDMVLAVAIAAWLGEHVGAPFQAPLLPPPPEPRLNLFPSSLGGLPQRERSRHEERGHGLFRHR
jgi:hypothetical protein